MRPLQNKLRLVILIKIIVLSFIIPATRSVEAQWPPFDFRLTPTYEDGKIIYDVKLSKDVEWQMADVVIRIAPPAGTRFLEAAASPGTDVTFDGNEVTFLTVTFHRPVRDATFTVEITDPDKTTFTTHAWIAWKGDHPGDYLTKDVTIDITKSSLDWARPRSRLQLEMKATATENKVVYEIYPENVSSQWYRMWDLKINIPLPPGTKFLSSEAPPPFTTHFDGQVVYFSIIEMENRVDVEPLRVTISTAEVTDPYIVTHAWASWTNSGRGVIRRVDPQETMRTGDIVVQPLANQQVVADKFGDTPLPNYDLTSIALQEVDGKLEINFYTVGEFENTAGPLEFSLYLDQDCQAETGGDRGNRGAEYWIRYRTNQQPARIYTWDETEEGWRNSTRIESQANSAQKKITIWVPFDLLDQDRLFCWIGRSRNRSDAFNEGLLSDWLGVDPRLTEYNVLPPTSSQIDISPQQAWSEFSSSELTNPAEESTAPVDPTTPPQLSGKLAIPFLNEYGDYTVHVYNLSDSQEIATIPNARQPNLSPDGSRLLVNLTGYNPGTIHEYSFADGSLKPVSGTPGDSRPFYDANGSRVVYDNDELVMGFEGEHRSFVFVQCGMRPPQQESKQICRDVAQFGILVPAGQVGEIRASHPVWTEDDRVAFNGCNAWAGASACGIYIVSAYSTKAFSDGFIPERLTDNTSDLPTDTQGSLLTFTSQRDGDWEAYLMNLDSTQSVNLSQSPSSNDGLPTISPDGNWVAFVSDRDGQWAVWVSSVDGQATHKMFDLPATPWGEGDRTWTTERISWGP